MTEKSIVDQNRRVKTGGRKAGTPNKVTAQLKEDILAALSGAGGIDYLQQVAGSHPAAFLSLIGKVLPMTVEGPGADGAHVFTVIERRIVKAGS